MKFVDAVEQYRTYLLKMSYLQDKDKQIAVFIKLYQKYGDQLPLENPKSYMFK